MASLEINNSPLFWTHEYSVLHEGKVENLELEVDGTSLFMPYTVVDGELHSPGIGTFGGFYSESDNIDWLAVCKEYSEKVGCISTIIFPPEYFAKNKFEEQKRVFLSNLDCIVIRDTNQHVEIDSDLEKIISRGNNKKLRQFRENGGYVLRNSYNDLEDVVSILEESRARLGVHLSMSRGNIRKAISTLPTIYNTYIAKIDNQGIAAAITVKISSTTVYVLYWGDRVGKWKSLSPTVGLFSAIYHDAGKDGVSILDLGVSSVNGIDNPGLARFKSNLGAVRTNRIKATFRK